MSFGILQIALISMCALSVHASSVTPWSAEDSQYIHVTKGDVYEAKDFIQTRDMGMVSVLSTKDDNVSGSHLIIQKDGQVVAVVLPFFM